MRYTLPLFFCLLQGCSHWTAFGFWYQTEDGGGRALTVWLDVPEPAARLPGSVEELTQWAYAARVWYMEPRAPMLGE